MVDCENVEYDVIKDRLHNVINSKIVYIVGRMQHEEKYQEIRTYSQTECVKCNVTSPNAADFILVTTMIQRWENDKFDRIIIISNDHGYDAVVNFLRQQSVQIKRTPPDNFVVPEGLNYLCAYISKHMKTGMSYEKLESECKGIFGDGVSGMISYLRQMGLIKVRKLKTYQAFFSASELKKAAFNHIDTEK